MVISSSQASDVDDPIGRLQQLVDGLLHTLSLLLQHEPHRQPRQGADDQGQALADAEALYVEPIVVVVADHVLRALEHKMGIVAEPEDVQHQHIPQVHDGPQQEPTPLWNGVFLATCIASAVGTTAMAFLANKPFVMAPGMGLNSFFAVIAGNIAAMLNTGYESAFQAALVIILVEGIVFILLSVFNIRDKIVHAIPLGVRLGIGPC